MAALNDDGQSRFRITPRPDARLVGLPVLPVDPDTRLADGEWIVWNVGHGFQKERLYLPDEAYLHEAADVDLDDPEALLAFVHAFGVPGEPDWRDLGDWSGGWWALTNGVGDVREKVLDRARQEKESLIGRSWWHVDEVAVRLAILRNCVSIWNAYDQGTETLDPDRIEQWYGDPVAGRWRHEGRPKDSRAAAIYLGHIVTFALRPYSPTILFGGEELEPAGDLYTFAFSALVRQLFNHMTERAAYSICQNEPCGRMFVRKRTGTTVAEQGRTTGRLYCSMSCQTSQNQREYRRRKRAEREQS